MYKVVLEISPFSINLKCYSPERGLRDVQNYKSFDFSIQLTRKEKKKQLKYNLRTINVASQSGCRIDQNRDALFVVRDRISD